MQTEFKPPRLLCCVNMTEGNGDHSRDDFTPRPQRPAVSWGVKIRKKLKPMTPFLGKFRPLVGQSCHQCTPESVGRQLLQNAPLLGFRNLLLVKETHTRYRGWLVRRVCCVLFICSRKVDSGRAGNRLLRICSTDRVKRVLTPQGGVEECGEEDTRGILTLAEASQSPSLIRLVSWLLLRFFSLMFCSVQVNLRQMVALHRATQQNIPLVYVYIRQGAVDQALISLTLLCQNLKVPYSVYPARVHNRLMRVILQKLGIVFLPDHAATEQEAETHSVYSPVMTSVADVLVTKGETVAPDFFTASWSIPRQSLQFFLRFPQALHTLRDVLPLANREVSLVRCPNHLSAAHLYSAMPQSYSKALPVCQAPPPITESKPSDSAEEPRFHRLYVRPSAFGHYPQLVTRDDDRDVDQ